jgi:elongation factor P hydroxylase
MCPEILPQNLVMPVAANLCRACGVKFRNKMALLCGKLDLADENVFRNVTIDVTWFPGYDVATKAQSFSSGLKNFTKIQKARRDRPV